MKNPPKKCINHPEQPARARGLCKKCYYYGFTKKHPEHRKKRRIYMQRWRAKNPDYYRNYYQQHPNARRNRDYKKKYGISLDSFHNLSKEQKGVCAICGNKENGTRNLSIDHDHKTGKIRGLLCQRCNALLGMVNDNIDTLIRASTYLHRYNQN